jgi:serine/threonine protein kinase
LRKSGSESKASRLRCDNNFIPNDKYLNKFEVMSEIGSGSYGHVFRVQQKSSLGLFAIKKIAIRDEIEPFKELCTSLLISKLSDSDISLPLV